MKLWDFTCTAERLESGQFRVVVTGTTTGERREGVGWHPLWELIRLLGGKGAAQKETT